MLEIARRPVVAVKLCQVDWSLLSAAAAGRAGDGTEMPGNQPVVY